jgi:predicted metal-dependent peptidase
VKNQNELKMQAARVMAQLKWPYLAGVLYNLKFIEVQSNELETMAVDSGWRLYWNTDFVSKTDAKELATVIIHECMHCMFEHSNRFESLPANPKNSDAWNLVGDCAINHILLKAGMVFPRDTPPVTFDHFNGKLDPLLTTEQNYFKLIEPSDDDSSPEAQDCGSAAGGGRRPYELDGDDEKAPSITRGAQALAKAQVREAILNGSGFDVPPDEELKRLMGELSKPKVSWKRELSNLMRPSIGTTMGRKDYSMMRLGRREGALRTKGFSPRLPAMRQPLPPKVSVILDTSPSMSWELLQRGLTEIIGIVRAVGAGQSITVIPCSGKSFPAQEVKTASQVKRLDLPGDEYTDLRNGFAAAMRERKKPRIIVVITDGVTPWPEQKPRGVDLVVILLTELGAEKNIPRWAKAIKIPA